MKKGDSVLIMPSCALSDLHLDALVGKTGQVVRIVEMHANITGCWVRFNAKYMNEAEWFIPYSSLI